MAYVEVIDVLFVVPKGAATKQIDLNRDYNMIFLIQSS